MNPFEIYVSALGKDISGYTVLSFKWNLSDASANLIPVLYNYAVSCNVDTSGQCVFATAGEHRQGKNENPHIHLNVALPNFKKDTNESRRRKKYLTDSCLSDLEGLTCKVKQIETIRDLENTLKYCWKEELPLPIKNASGYRYVFPEDVRLYLTQSAVALFEVSKDDSRKKERATAVAKTLQGQIMDIVKGKRFESYTEFKIYVCAEVYRPLDISEYPTANHLRNEVQNVAINTGVVPPHYFI